MHGKWLDQRARTIYSSTTESVLWRIAGPSAYQMQETMLKMTKHGVHMLSLTVRLQSF